MSKKRPKVELVSQAVRRAVVGSGLSLYRLSVDSGVSYAALHRFMAGERSLSLDGIDKLAAHLGLELRKRRG